MSKFLLRIFYFLLGLFLFAFAFKLFLEPNDLVFGGVTGLSIIFKKLFGINTSLFVLITSLLLLLLSYVVLGRKKTMGSVCGSLLLPLFLELAGLITEHIVLEDTELFMMAIFGGIIAGVGLGLVYRSGFTTGGTDILNQIVHKYIKISIGNAMLVTDGLIVTSSIFVFGFTMFMYALVVLYIITYMTDRVIFGVGKSKAFYIVTEKQNEVKDFILNTLGHGVTVLNATGGYSKENQKVLFCVIPTRDYYLLKEGISKIDNDVFFVVTNAYEVLGGE